MYFEHAREIWADFPELAAIAVFVEGVTSHEPVTDRTSKFLATARERLALTTEGQLPEIQAWRRTFARTGLRPTQYRCASESLLRRLRKENALPHVHPLVDLCNAVSVAYAIPVAVFDVAQVDSGLEVRYAHGDEDYLTFDGVVEHPEPGEVIFADRVGHAHARRWTNRQSGRSAATACTVGALIVAEAMHSSSRHDVEDLAGTLATEVEWLGAAATTAGILTPSARTLVFPPSAQSS